MLRGSKPLPTHAIFDICLVGGQMQFFQRRGINVNADERDRLLKLGVEKAIEACGTPTGEVTEFGISFKARKKS